MADSWPISVQSRKKVAETGAKSTNLAELWPNPGHVLPIPGKLCPKSKFGRCRGVERSLHGCLRPQMSPHHGPHWASRGACNEPTRAAPPGRSDSHGRSGGGRRGDSRRRDHTRARPARSVRAVCARERGGHGGIGRASRCDAAEPDSPGNAGKSKCAKSVSGRLPTRTRNTPTRSPKRVLRAYFEPHFGQCMPTLAKF